MTAAGFDLNRRHAPPVFTTSASSSPSFLWSSALIVSVIAAPLLDVSFDSLAIRSKDTCADTSLATTFMQVFYQKGITHALGPRAYTINGITKEGATTDWEFQGDIFVAWNTEQEFTVPLYRFDLGVAQDYMYTTATAVPGYTLGIIIGYVYETQVCGSVPLLGAFNQAETDHYYTTAPNEHSQLIAISGWTDVGVAGYVLPLGTGKLSEVFLMKWTSCSSSFWMLSLNISQIGEYKKRKT
ncbi:hypothetical protein CVT26_011286 [Gymnopilus dilepis]|uniref:DUF5648 domain-containing protein n=1 Tax=Gymnopilus dilepis TaxID=231916 RepID=A0A409VJL5_9AGAR|nr:hypothetical protein CVT26_011286 [Gymnopilus dilepis]